MVSALVVLLLSLAFGADYEDGYEKLKSQFSKMRAKPTWEFGLNPRLRGMSEAQLKSLCGSRLEDISHLPTAETNFRGSLPRNFDARQKWGACTSIKLIRDQSSCGSCWAVSAASVMSDRHCIAAKGKDPNCYVSDEYLVACCRECGKGCKGGRPDIAFHFFNKGIPSGGIYGSTTGCQPYSIRPGQAALARTPPCRGRSCIPQWRKSFDQSLYYGGDAYHIRTVEAAMQEIYNIGPIVATFVVYEDFFYYRGGVYSHRSGKSVGGHGIRIIGWGEERGVPYWLIANSWNKTWGMGGLFKMKRGSNECEIENVMMAGRAKLN